MYVLSLYTSLFTSGWFHLFELLNLIPQGIHHIHQAPWRGSDLQVSIWFSGNTLIMLLVFTRAMQNATDRIRHGTKPLMTVTRGNESWRNGFIFHLTSLPQCFVRCDWDPPPGPSSHRGWSRGVPFPSGVLFQNRGTLNDRHCASLTISAGRDSTESPSVNP